MIRIARKFKTRRVVLYIKQNEGDDEDKILQDAVIVYLYDSISNDYKYRIDEKWKRLSGKHQITHLLKRMVEEYCRKALRGICD